MPRSSASPRPTSRDDELDQSRHQAPARQADGELGKGIGLDNDWVVNDRQGGRQLRRDLRAQRRHGLARSRSPAASTTSGTRAACSTPRPSDRSKAAAAPAANMRPALLHSAKAAEVRMAVDDERSRIRRAPRARAGFFYRPEVRQAIYQIVLVVALVALFCILITNTAANLQAAEHRLRLRLHRPHGRLRHLPAPDRTTTTP